MKKTVSRVNLKNKIFDHSLNIHCTVDPIVIIAIRGSLLVAVSSIIKYAKPHTSRRAQTRGACDP